MKTTQTPPLVLTIAGSDPSGGAGIQGDLKTIERLGGQGMAVIAGLTAQSTLGVTDTMGVPPEFVLRQLETLWEDVPPFAAKTGMLATREIVAVVSGFLRNRPLPLVVDPVMVSTSGARLLSEDAVDAFRRELIPMATLVTPNAQETEVLADQPVGSLDQLTDAARTILDMGARALLIKGGDSILGGEQRVWDLYWEQGQPEPILLESPRHYAGPHRSFHGSGCCLAAAAASALAFGFTPINAMRRARLAVSEAIIGAIATGRGAIPVNHHAISSIVLDQ